MSDDYIYVNLLSIAPTGPSAPVQVVYQEYRSEPIVDDASKYKLSVIRWAATGLNLPLFIPLVDTTQNNPNVLVYKVRLSAAGTTATESVVWSPQYNATAPTSTVGVDFNVPYYWANDYSWFLTRVNVALLACYNTIKAANPSLTAAAPYFVFANNYFQLYADTIGYGPGATENWTLSINPALKLLLDHFPMASIDTNGFSSFNVAPSGVAPKTGGSPNYWIQQQQAPSTDTWSPIESITFTTNSAIQVEESSPPNILGAGSNTSASRNFIPALTDFNYALTNGAMDYMGVVSYSPSAQFRYSNLLQSADLKSLNFAVFWKCRYNASLYAVNFTQGGGGSISVKILLERIPAGGI